jgi:penicillin-binding protein 1B
MASPGRNVYSKQRLRLVLILLTVVTLPFVVGGFTLIYYYLKFSVMVERRLQGERFLVPSRIYARPLVLRNGLPLTRAGLVKTLNGLKYEQQAEGTPVPGAFVVGDKNLVFTPRAQKDAADEPLLVVFEKDRVKEIRGLSSKKRYARQALEPELITYLFDASREKRRRIRYEELPDALIKAVLAIEDRRFFSHPGLDPFRLGSAIVRNLRTDSGTMHGASTITQQLCKNFFLTPERTLRRKSLEAILAFVLERRAEKKDILELYLNEVYLGQAGSFSINGVGEAARMYFHKDVGNLTLAEGALLAGMIQSPNPYNPYRHAQRATERRNQVIRAMNDAGFIDEPSMKAALDEPLHVQSGTMDTTEAPYFVDLVRTQLAQHYDAKDLTTQNLAVHTTLDLQLQGLAQKAVENGLDNVVKLMKRKDDKQPQACLIAIEPTTGNLVALVGGRSYGSSQYNRVIQARRQPGSTFKPFVYLAAFEAFFDDPALPPITPATVVEDAPAVFFYEDKEYIPQNYEDKYLGYVTLRKALANSLNVATVKVAEMVGYDRVADLWSKRLKIGAPIKAYPALALGAFEATPYEMAIAYNILANGGLKVEPVTVLDVSNEKGQTLEQHEPAEPERVVHEASAYLVTNMLRSVINEGTAASARAADFRPDAAGKTGTTNDMRDAWFAGYTPDLLCIVWVGFDDNTPIGFSGTRVALPIWVEFMKGALSGVKTRSFPVPEEHVVFTDVDRETGQLPSASTSRVLSEAFIAGTEPHGEGFH